MTYTGQELIRVIDWDKHFENNVSRQRTKCNWVAIPNKLDGDGYIYLISCARGESNYAAWILMVLVASRCKPRGTLIDTTGRPHTPATLSMKTRAPEAIFSEAINVLLRIGWIELVSPEEAEEIMRAAGPQPEFDLDVPVIDDGPTTKDLYAEYVEHINKVLGRNYRGCKKSLKQFGARLSDGFTIEDFKTAVNNASKDDYHREKKFKYITPEFLTRADKLDRFMNREVQADSAFGEEES